MDGMINDDIMIEIIIILVQFYDEIFCGIVKVLLIEKEEEQDRVHMELRQKQHKLQQKELKQFY